MYKYGNSIGTNNNDKAYKLLEDLEDLHIIKVLKLSIQPKQQFFEKYTGKLPSYVAEELQIYVNQSPNKWNIHNI